jgi:uncharacterized protein YifE (UPF0438 family)
VELGQDYPALGKYSIRTVGHWMEALASGSIKPLHPAQEHFVQVCRGEKSPDNDVEKAWLRFVREYPDRREFSGLVGETSPALPGGQ